MKMHAPSAHTSTWPTCSKVASEDPATKFASPLSSSTPGTAYTVGPAASTETLALFSPCRARLQLASRSHRRSPLVADERRSRPLTVQPEAYGNYLPDGMPRIR